MNATPLKNTFTLHNISSEEKSRHILSYHTLSGLKNKDFNYPYIVVIPKFHKNPLKFRTMTSGYNTYNTHANTQF